MTEQKKTKRKLTIARAVSEALYQEMEADPSVFVMGEDVGKLGGAFGNTQGLFDKFGEDRVRDTPISETAFISTAVGAAAMGMRPVVELMFVDFFGVCMDAIYNLAAKNAYFSAGKQAVPMVLMTSVGGGYGDAGQHSQCLYATFAHLPGMKVVIPSTAYDAKGLMMAAIEDNNPVVFMMHKALQGMGWLGTVQESIVAVPEEPYTVPLGKASVLREGNDISLIGLGATAHLAMTVAKQLDDEGVNAEVIDLRSIVPLDREAILESVAKTGRLIIIDDDYSNCGLAGEIIATVTEHDVSLFKSSPRRIAHPDIPIPFSPPMEHFALPDAEKVMNAAKDMLGLRSAA